jgi:hypothetical protein
MLRLPVGLDEPSDAFSQYDFLRKSRTIGEQMCAALGVIEIRAEQHRDEAA